MSHVRSGNKTHQWHELVEILIGSWKDPYNGLLWSLYSWVVFQFFTSMYTSNKLAGFWSPRYTWRIIPFSKWLASPSCEMILASLSCASYSQGPTPSTTPWGYRKKVRVDHPCKGLTSCLLTSWHGVSCQRSGPQQKKITHTDTQVWCYLVVGRWSSLVVGRWKWLKKNANANVVWFDQSIHLGVLMTSACPSPQTASDCPTALAALVLSASRPSPWAS